jgi:hypothetical protein
VSLRGFKGRESIGHVSEHAEALAGEVVQLDLGLGMHELGVAAAGQRVPIARAPAGRPIRREVVARFSLELVAPTGAAVHDIGNGSNVLAQKMTILVSDIGHCSAAASAIKLSLSHSFTLARRRGEATPSLVGSGCSWWKREPL